MSTLAPVFLAFVCSIFGTTSEPTNHGQFLGKSELASIHRTNPRLAHFYNTLDGTTSGVTQHHVQVKERSTAYDRPTYTSRGARKYDAKVRGKRRTVYDTEILSYTSRTRQYDVKTRGKTVKAHNERPTYTNSDRRQDIKAREKSRAVYSERQTYISRETRQYDVKARSKRGTEYNPCDPFTFKEGTLESTILTHPKDHPDDKTYSSNTTCITTIEAVDGRVVVLSFVDKFMLEGQPPKCEYDHLEIRDGQFGYAVPKYKYCGTTPPPTIRSSGPFMWLKFHSDDTIEQEGFQIKVEFEPNSESRKRSSSCYIPVTGMFGEIGSHSADVKECRTLNPGSLDIQWKIETPPDTSIFLNFTEYGLALPNDCESNIVQVFGAEPNFDHKLAVFCGSVSNAVTTKLPKDGLGPSNIMYIRLFTNSLARDTKFKAHFTAFRTLVGEDTCRVGEEFDCEDSSCIAFILRCNARAECRTKADEDEQECAGEKESIVNEPRILVMLSIFSVGLFIVGFVFLFKCIRKLYKDHQVIKEHLASQDRLNRMSEDRVTFDPNLERGSESLERENFTNEMYHENRKSSSIGSDFLGEDTPPDLDNDWPESTPILSEDTREPNGRHRRNDSNREKSPKIMISKADEEEHKSKARRKNSKKEESPRTKISKGEWKDEEYKSKSRRKDSNKEKLLRAKSLKGEEEKETEYKGRPRRSDATKEEELKDHDWKETGYKGKPRRKNSSKKEDLLRTKSLNEEWKEMDNDVKPSCKDSNKKELLRTMPSKEEDLKDIECKDRPRRDDVKKDELLRTKSLKEESKIENKSISSRMDLAKIESLKTQISKEEEWKEPEYKGRPSRTDTTKKEDLLRYKTKEDRKETEYKDKPSRSDTNKTEELLRTRSKEYEWKEAEYKSKPRRDLSKKEESLRSNGSKEERVENRDMSVGTLDTKEFGCQTRESLFLTDPVPSSDGTNSNSNSRGLSAFACSDNTVARASPSPARASQITVELLRQDTPRSSSKTDRRPSSSETTRSAPDVIIVARPAS